MTSGIHRILVSANPAHADAQSFLGTVRATFPPRGIAVDAWFPGQDCPDLSVIDAVLVLGGDGFLMSTIRSLDYPTVPFYGVNYGQVGFLMNPRVSADELATLFESQTSTIASYPVLYAEIELEDGRKIEDQAFNDFVLERASGQTVHLLANIDGVPLNRYSGDGLVVASPGGSSAYSLAAGGPVVHEAVGAMIVTPLYPHRPVQFHSLQFPVLLPLSSEVEIVAQSVDKRPVRFVADGRSIEHVRGVHIGYRGVRVQLLREPNYHFIDTLVKKIIGTDDH